MGRIPRIIGHIPQTVEMNVASELFALAVDILSIPRIQTEALVVFPGMGEDERVIHAVK
ncbi:MAG: hypothetical protein UY74_C0068G0008 [Candidatus Kaiserbacteria bacterium GW2011_GWC2_52_8b]|uniref:Uncharacterized protein n=2 Tax=Candidatus Kaiseribacteriota TaxID=1752734 RepID=A0A0G2AB82_9BACT|nr:MAG: hypothetical protein UY67_C0024G0029 [Candidatus Kaiserbacteria bacterium GW2011_GWA2_52_12]KKW29629.1 MAG: hypothetical protein UY74_C0068G0008 [Candidatus Kaiserbacteria bacterium GW2011_GWC2_52_8b]